MILPSNNPEIFAIQHLLEKNDETVNDVINIHIGAIVEKLGLSDTGFNVLSIEEVEALSSVELWVLIFIAVHQEMNLHQSPRYMIMSALKSFQTANPNAVDPEDPLTPFEVANILFDTKLDTTMFFMGLDIIMKAIMSSLHEQHLEEAAAAVAETADSSAPAA
jgi:predicted ATP-dependent Lon-type protease